MPAVVIEHDLTVAGAYSTRQFEHIFDLSYRLFDASSSLPVNTSGLNSVAILSPTWDTFAVSSLAGSSPSHLSLSHSLSSTSAGVT